MPEPDEKQAGEAGPRVAWIHYAPIKGTRIHAADEVLLEEEGIRGDRTFFAIDENGDMVSSRRLGPLLGVVAEHDEEAGTLALRFPDGTAVRDRVELGPPETLRFFGEEHRAHVVLGPFAAALSAHAGAPLRLVLAPPGRPGVDLGVVGPVSLLSAAAVEALAAVAGVESIDNRRFRMNFGIAGLAAHGEDEWVGRTVAIGGARVEVKGTVGRCVLTTRNPDAGEVDFKTLHHLRATRLGVDPEVPLPFGVYATVLEPGRVRVGDPVGVSE